MLVTPGSSGLLVASVITALELLAVLSVKQKSQVTMSGVYFN